MGFGPKKRRGGEALNSIRDSGKEFWMLRKNLFVHFWGQNAVWLISDSALPGDLSLSDCRGLFSSIPGQEFGGHPGDEALSTVTTKGRLGVAEPFVIKFTATIRKRRRRETLAQNQRALRPLDTQTASALSNFYHPLHHGQRRPAQPFDQRADEDRHRH